MTAAADKPPQDREPASNTDLPPQNNHVKKMRVMVQVTLGILLVALLVFLYWWFILRLEVSTSDAYVEGDLVNINSRQEGVVLAFYADNNDLVEEGQLLVELDPTDFLLAYENAKANLALMTRQVREMAEKVDQYRQEVILRRAQLLLDTFDYRNREPLVPTGAVSEEELETYRTKVEVAQASLFLSEHLLAQSLAALGDTPLPEHPMILQAKDMLREAFLRVVRCRILSPVRGYVAMRNVQVGESIDVLRNMMSVVPLDRVWVTANYKETQLYWLRIGQPTTVRVDQYGHRFHFHGKVQGIGAGTGSVFSLLPPQNATGNWIKIVQRLPVRIDLDPRDIEKNPLRLGLSCTAYVDISDTAGKVLAQEPSKEVVAKTAIYDIPLKPLEEEMEEIIVRNLSYPEAVLTRAEP